MQSLYRLGSAFGTFVLDALFPLTCVSCSRVGTSLCEVCEITLLMDAWPPQDIPGVYSCFAYANPSIRKLLTRYKYNGELAAGEALVRLFQKRLTQALFLPDIRLAACAIPVPLSRRKFLERGFNQAEVLGRVAAQVLVLPLEDRLQRSVDVGQLAGKTDVERKELMRDTPFVATGVWPEMVLLIDDVYTTGATAKAAIEALERAGVAKALLLTYARGAAH